MFVSVGPDSARSLFSAAISSRGMGAWLSFGGAVSQIAKRMDLLSLKILSEPGMSTVRPMVSSIYKSMKPRASTGKSTISSMPSFTGISGSRNSSVGTRSGFGAWRVLGSQSLFKKMAFARSHTVSEINPHLYGPGAPPKVRLSAMNAKSRRGNWVQVWMVVDQLRCSLRKSCRPSPVDQSAQTISEHTTLVS